jgi:hypothetical protein
MDDLRRTTVAAVLSSFLLVGFLLLFVINAVRQPEARATLFVQQAFVLAWTCLTIRQWIRCARKYIDHAIDRRLAASGRERQPS